MGVVTHFYVVCKMFSLVLNLLLRGSEGFLVHGYSMWLLGVLGCCYSVAEVLMPFHAERDAKKRDESPTNGAVTQSAE